MRQRRFKLALAVLLAAGLLPSCGSRNSHDVDLVPVPASAQFADAVAPGSLSWACASDASQLPPFFQARNVPFRPDLVQNRNGRECHIFYEPTVPGFRAGADNTPASELFANVNTLAFLARRQEASGDSLDVLKAISAQTPIPLKIDVDVSVPYQSDLFEGALQAHFPDSDHQFTFHHDPFGDIDPWVQDVLKYGSAAGQRKVLVTHRAFEGDPRMGPVLRPMLDTFRQRPDFARSKLTFEGGDLLFAVSPQDERRLTLFYGSAAKPYWGEALTIEEFGYVLQVEFGAEDAVYFGGLTPHLDYALSLLPDGRTALLVEPKQNDPGVARAALQLLEESYKRSPSALQSLLEDDRWQDHRPAIVQAAEEARQASWSWESAQETAQKSHVTEYVEQNCPGRPADCVNPDRIPLLVARHLPLVQRWLRLGTAVQERATLAPRLLELIAAQASGGHADRSALLESKVDELQRMGYRVIRVPMLGGAGNSPWPGVSYANLAVAGNTLFVPQLGLGEIEERWFAQLERELPKPFTVRPVPARALLLGNGGIHCALAFGRATAN